MFKLNIKQSFLSSCETELSGGLETKSRTFVYYNYISTLRETETWPEKTKSKTASTLGNC